MQSCTPARPPHSGDRRRASSVEARTALNNLALDLLASPMHIASMIASTVNQVCRKCGISKPHTCYGKSRSGHGSGVKRTCKTCEGGPRVSAEVRFWRNVDKRCAEECWPWMGPTDVDGYGIFKVDRRRKRAHRVAFEMHTGSIDASLLVCHRCDNPCCCNPIHLFQGTNADNVRDRHAKGRDAKGDANGMRLHPESRLRGDEHWTRKKPERLAHQKGEAHGMAKLTESNVIEIRRIYASGGFSQQRLADIYGVSQRSIGDVIRRKKWSHVE
jgi:hypothetical protein